MSSTPRMPREQRRAQLLELATDLFTERGFQATSMDDIASAAGVTKPVLYQHFASKEDLYGAVVEITGARLLDAVASLAELPGPTEDRVRAGITRFYDLVNLDNALRLFTGYELVSEDLAARVAQVLDEMSVSLATVLAAHRRYHDSQARIVGRSLISLTRSTAMLLHEAADEDERQQILNDVTTLAVHGLSAFTPIEGSDASSESN